MIIVTIIVIMIMMTRERRGWLRGWVDIIEHWSLAWMFLCPSLIRFSYSQFVSNKLYIDDIQIMMFTMMNFTEHWSPAWMSSVIFQFWYVHHCNFQVRYVQSLKEIAIDIPSQQAVTSGISEIFELCWWKNSSNTTHCKHCNHCNIWAIVHYYTRFEVLDEQNYADALLNILHTI